MAPSTLQRRIPPENMEGRTDYQPGPSLLISGYDSAIEDVNMEGVIGAEKWRISTSLIPGRQVNDPVQRMVKGNNRGSDILPSYSDLDPRRDSDQV